MDPIGIVARGGPAYEYDRYIDGIDALLMDPRRSQDAIAAHLLDIQSRRMGYESPRPRSNAATGRRDRWPQCGWCSSHRESRRVIHVARAHATRAERRL